MSENLRITLGQINFMVGDIEANAKRVIEASQYARDHQQSDAILFPEMTLLGYPAEDLIFRAEIYSRIEAALQSICQETIGIDVILGFPTREETQYFNTAAVLRAGKVLLRYHKQKLPNYTVFDEKRYFIPGKTAAVFKIKDIPIGLIICEDLWFPEPAAAAAHAGAKILLGMNASPFRFDKAGERLQVLKDRVKETGMPILYSQWAGAQDELVFDGGSMAINENGDVCAHAGFFHSSLLPVDFELKPKIRLIPQILPPQQSTEAQIYQALIVGVRDYVHKNGVKGIVLGLSGGIDSALTLAIAVDALGKENVETVMLPSRYTSTISLEDAQTIANYYGVKYSIIPIDFLFDSFTNCLSDHFANLPPDSTEENLQARIRGTLLMAIANKAGKFVLTTSNRSELAVGYSTLYGDTAGAFDVLKDVPKTLVYRLANYCNRDEEKIPQRIIDRPPSAELRENQEDQDSLPPYEILDEIVHLYVVEEKSASDIIGRGFSREIVDRILGLIDRNEYKRRQSPPGTRIGSRAFGRDRRYPITNGFKST